MRLRSSNAGFTLIELMAVIIIVTVLLAVALPAYQNQVIRGHRAAAKAEMLEIGNRQEQFLLSDRRYTATLSDIAYTLPPEVAARYTSGIVIVAPPNRPTYTITFTPIGAQVGDGPLTINSEGDKLPADKWAR